MTDERPPPPEDEAWFRPQDPPPPGSTYPRGVVAGGAGTDPYRRLRHIEEDDGSWPFDDPGMAPPRTSRMPPFIVGLILGAVLAAGSVFVFNLLAPTDEPSAAPTTSGATTTSTPATTTPPATETSSTGPAGTTSTSVATTTTTTLPAIEPSGDPIAVDDLRLAANAIGPLQFGSAGTDVLGRLVASLGEPDADTGPITGDGTLGTCPGDVVRIVRWGPLSVVVTGEPAGFVSYRLDIASGGLDDPAAQLATLSGLQVGDDIATLESIYDSFTISYVEDPELESLVFELRRQADDRLLLWGPISSAASDGVVTGIFSPDSCSS